MARVKGDQDGERAEGKAEELPKGMEKRGKVYYAKFRSRGQLIRKRLSSDLRTATRLLKVLQGRAEESDAGIKSNNAEWVNIRDSYLKACKSTVKNVRDYETAIRNFEEFASLANIRDITPDLISDYQHYRARQFKRVAGKKANDGRGEQRVSNRTINKEIGVIRSMLNYAVESGKIAYNPVRSVKPLDRSVRRKIRRSLSMFEFQSLLAESPDYLRPVWRMFLATGLRRDELTGLQFSDIDFERKSITVTRTKNKEVRIVPLDDEMVEILRRLRSEAKNRRPVAGTTPSKTERQAANFSRDHVFVTKANTPWGHNLLARFYTCAKRAGIEDANMGGSVDIHSLRVTFATMSIENGGSPKAVQEILGHKSLEMTMGIYAKVTDRAKRDAISALPFAECTPPTHVLVSGVRKVCASTSQEQENEGKTKRKLPS